MNIIDTNVTIMVKDMDESIRFYEQIGMKVKSRWGNHYAMLTGPGITLGIHPGGDGKPDSHISIGFIIENIDDAKSLFEKNNITYKSSNDGSGIFAHTKSPDGTTVYFMQPKYGEPDQTG